MTLKLYTNQNFTCNRCKRTFYQQSLYSVALSPDQITRYSTYCATCARNLNLKKNMSKTVKPKKSSRKKTAPKKALVLAPIPKLAKTKSSPTDYFNCLLNYSQQGFYDAQEGKKLKIHACCKKCKLSASSLNSSRDKELVKLITSYQQVGDSLAKLLKPLS